MAVKLKKSGRGEYAKAFRSSHAVVIGINGYGNGIQPLTTPVNDAVRLAEQLEAEHGYTVHLLVEDVTKARIETCLTAELPPQIGENDRLLLYFAGHGVALDGEDGPQGFLVPQDADPKERNSFLPMTELHGWLDDLPCRHMLAILDCCFAGAFRWAATRNVDVLPEVIHQERFERYLISPAWQVLTSAAYDQRALDVIADKAVGARGVRETNGERHSPFALALYKALRGEGDLIPKGDGDGVITATELYLYLREQVEVEADVQANHEQTPGLWPLNKHGKGEYIFLSPGHELNLPPAPNLTEELNPWRGLKSYDEEHKELFFGRDQEIDELCARVHDMPFTAVLGASGTGKSSLVKAGLLPQLAEQNGAWLVLPPLRPGATPLANLRDLLAAKLTEFTDQVTVDDLKSDSQALANIVSAWKQDNPDGKLILMVDQLEELVTLADDAVQEQFLALLAAAVEAHPENFRLVTTLRTDFEPQFNADSRLAEQWGEARYVVPPMDQADLRQVIEGPASVRVLYFEPPELVDTLITEVIQTPGALPLLSFTLSEMYIHYLKSGRDNRALTQEDYEALGGVIGSLRTRANEEYESLPDDAHRETMEKVMLRMISVEGGELARRRVLESELVYADEAENEHVRMVLDSLVGARLLVTGEEDGWSTVEPAHDALVLAWDRLLRWKKEAESYLPLQRRLAQAATEWESAEAQAQSGLLWDDDPRLPILEETLWPTGGKKEGLGGRARWAKQVLLPSTDTPADTGWLNRAEVSFVQTSVQARASFWQRLVGITSVVVIALGALAFFASIQANEAIAQANIAATNEAAAFAAEETAVAEADRANVQTTRAVENEQIASNERATAEAERAEALLQSQRAQAQSLQANSRALIGRSGTNRELAAARLLAIEGARMNDLVGSLEEQAVNEALLYALAYENPFSYQPEATLADHSDDVTNVAWNGDGSLLATVACRQRLDQSLCVQSEIIIWDAENHKSLEKLVGHRGSIHDLAWDRQSERLASASIDSTIIIWDTITWQPKAILEDHTDKVNSIAWSSDGDVLASAAEDRTIIIWDTNTWQPLETLAGHTEGVTRVAWSDDGSHLASVSCGERESGGDEFCTRDEIIIWDTDTWQQLTSLSGHTDAVSSEVTDVVWKPDGSRLASASEDNKIIIWDTADWQPLVTLTDHAETVSKLSWSPEGDRLASASWDDTVIIWDTADWQPLVTLVAHMSAVLGVAWNEDGSRLASASEDDTAIIWDAESWPARTVLDDHTNIVTAVAWKNDDSLLASASCGKVDDIGVCIKDEIFIWDMYNMRPLEILSSRTGVTSVQIWSLDWNSDGSWLASASNDGTVTVWDTASWEPLATLRGHDFGATSATWNADDSRLASSATDATIMIWDTQSWQPLMKLTEHRNYVTSTAWSHDGRYLASAACGAFSDNSCDYAEIIIWETESWQPLVILSGNTHDLAPDIFSLAWNADDSLLASASSSGMAVIWDTENWQPIERLTAHADGVNSVAWSHDGSRLASGSWDNTIIIWDTSVWQPLASFADHDDGVLGVAWSHDGSRLASAALDETVIVREMPDLVQLQCRLAGRNLSLTEWNQYLPDKDYRCTCEEWPAAEGVPPDAPGCAG